VKIFKAALILLVALFNFMFYVLLSEAIAQTMESFGLFTFSLGMVVTAMLLHQFSQKLKETLEN
jgi:glucose uptake protein GlcU